MASEYDYAANRAKFVDGRGVRITSGLFEELADPDSGFKPSFKLADWRKVYIDVADPTGYNAARVLIGNWEHWLLLVANPRFKAALDEWNKEVEVKLRSQAVQQMMKISKTLSGTAAAKWLAEGGFTEHDGRRKKDKENEAATQKEVRSNVAEHAARLGIKAVK